MADISKINAVALANIAKVDAVAAAAIAKINGLVFSTAGAFLLDTYTGAAAGYSVRKLKTGVTVAARIRRSGDDIEADVEFDSNNEISLTSPISNASSGTYTDLADFVDHSTTPRNAFCVEWKDQSGNGNDATQPTAGGSGLQPKVYDATTGLITEGGKSAILWDGSNDYLQTSTSTQFTSHTLFMAHAPTGTGSARKFLIETTGGSIFNPSVEYMDSTYPSKIRQFATDSSNPTINNTTTGTYDASTRLITAQRDNTATNGIILAIDGTVTNQTTGATITATSTGFNLGTYRLANDRFFQGKFQEVILYNSFKNSTDVDGIETNINSDYLIYQPTDAPTSGLLATYTGAAAAYSVRQLSDKAVIALRIRRDSDDEEINIGFDSNGDLDTTAISDFCSTANGYVTRWWDQSTNGNHADQATDTSQPQIYNAATGLITENGKPALLANSNVFLDVSITGNSTAWVFTCIKGPGPGGRAILWSNQGSPWIAYAQDGDTRDSWTTSATPNHYLNGSSITAPTRDGLHTLIGSQSLLTLDANTSGYTTGSRLGVGLGVGMITYTQEFILYHSDQSSNRTGIESNVNTYFSIYT